MDSLLMDAKAQGLDESSPRALSLQQIIVALNMVSKVICINTFQG
jgi:exportin-T